jgi:hypothetical protein
VRVDTVGVGVIVATRDNIDHNNMEVASQFVTTISDIPDIGGDRETFLEGLQNFLNNTPPYSIYTEYVPYTLETYHVFLLADDNTLYNLTTGFILTPHESGHLCQLKEQYRRDLHTLTEGRDATIQALLMVCEYV